MEAGVSPYRRRRQPIRLLAGSNSADYESLSSSTKPYNKNKRVKIAHQVAVRASQWDRQLGGVSDVVQQDVRQLGQKQEARRGGAQLARQVREGGVRGGEERDGVGATVGLIDIGASRVQLSL